MTMPSTGTINTSLIRDLLHAGRYYLLSRRGIAIVATIAIVAGIAFNWNWLVATGIAPILLTALPCAVMCGFGLCFNRIFGSSCSQESSGAGKQTTDAATQNEIAETQPLDERRDPHA